MMVEQHRQLDILFVSERPVWPLDQGFRINTCHTAHAMDELGVQVGLATMAPPTGDEPEHIRKLLIGWPQASAAQVRQFEANWKGTLQYLRKRIARFLAPGTHRLAGIVELISRHNPKVVIGVGQQAPIILRGIQNINNVKTIWFALDELVYFHYSCLKRESIKQYPARLRRMAIHALMENIFARGLDGAVGVNPIDTRLLEVIAGVKNAATIRNGVDIDFFTREGKRENSEEFQSLVFWGRMDFEPNIDAACWFANNVWPRLRLKHPHARWNIIGMNPHPDVKKLDSIPGISVLGPVNDIRPYATGAGAVILPMRCGGGIKNKLLEAAAMAQPIVCSPHAVKGLVFGKWEKPVAICKDPAEYVDTISRVWQDSAYANHLADTAEKWVRDYHTWPKAARNMTTWINTLLDGQPIEMSEPVAGNTSQAEAA